MPNPFSSSGLRTADSSVYSDDVVLARATEALSQLDSGVLERLTRQRSFSHVELMARGAGGSLTKGYERYVPLERLDGLEPRPSNNESVDGAYVFGSRIVQPIEVVYDADLDVYMVEAGNHRIAQALANGQTHILAFVEPDRSTGRDFIGTHPLRSDPDEALFSKPVQKVRPW